MEAQLGDQAQLRAVDVGPMRRTPLDAPRHAAVCAVGDEAFVVAHAAPVRSMLARPLLDPLQAGLRCRCRPPAFDDCEHGLECARGTFMQEWAMIEVYSWATPNGHKVHIMLEECALPYKVVAVDIGAGDQFR